ncbi:RrF2 family transcriptional regulator [Piscinibacter sp.]|uniref:RrF2 family transcriptional regulator n=1 Tax=Piscinibacter sp. TaxID=1903157 RepID=UPI0039E40816
MRLTAMTDYSLRLLMHVGQHGGRLCTIAEIAQVYGISEAHLMKITHQLALAGFLETLRGRGGGMRLARPPAEIGIGDVVRAMEPDFAMVECFATGNACTLSGQCRLTGVLHGSLMAFMENLDRYTLADLIEPMPAPAQRGAQPVAFASRGSHPR